MLSHKEDVCTGLFCRSGPLLAKRIPSMTLMGTMERVPSKPRDVEFGI